MAYFDINNSVPVTENFLSYNYPICTLYNNGQWAKRTVANSAKYYYKITYPSCTQNSALLVYNQNGIFHNYRPTYMYIFGLLHHNISGLTADGASDTNNIIGEIVIEHENSSTETKVYLCILIKESSSSLSEPTTIDSVLEMINSGSAGYKDYLNTASIFNMSNDIPPKEKTIIYTDANSDSLNVVIILTEPIVISAAKAITEIKMLSTDPDGLFSLSAPDSYVKETSIAGSEKTGAANADGPSNVMGKYGSDDIYIDCQPTGSSLEEITTYNIPIGSALSQDMQKMDFMKTSVNFFLFCLGLVLVYIIVPMLYKMVVIDKVISYITSPSDSATIDIERKRWVRASDTLISLTITFFILYSFYYGFKNEGDYTMITNGLFGFVLLGISFSLILVKKLDKDFLTHNGIEINPWTKENETNVPLFDMAKTFALIGGCLNFMADIKGALAPIIAVEILNLIVFLILRYGTHAIDDATFKKYMVQNMFLYIPLVVTLLMFLAKP